MAGGMIFPEWNKCACGGSPNAFMFIPCPGSWACHVVCDNPECETEGFQVSGDTYSECEIAAKERWENNLPGSGKGEKR